MRIHHDTDAHRFTASVEGGTAVLRYEPVDDATVDFQSTWVPPEARKRGVGLLLVEHALDWAEQEGKAVIPTCWFVKDVLDARAS